MSRLIGRTRFLLCVVIVCAGGPSAHAGQKQVGSAGVYPLHVRFVDERGLPVRDLSAAEVKVFESGSPLPVEGFLDPSTVFDVGLLLDVSPSVHEMVDITQAQTGRFFHSLPLESEALLLTFDTQTYVDCDWTTDRKAMDEAIYELGLHKPGDTSILFESVVVALEKKLRERGYRQALIVLSDGVETGSHDVSEKESLRVARNAGVLLFSVQSDSREHYRRLHGGTRAYDPTIMTEPPGTTGGGVGGIFVGTGRPTERDVAEYKVEQTFNRAAEYMRKLADAGRTRHTFLVNFSDLGRVFEDILGDLTDVCTVLVRSSRTDGRFHPTQVISNRKGVTAVPVTGGYWARE